MLCHKLTTIDTDMNKGWSLGNFLETQRCSLHILLVNDTIDTCLREPLSADKIESVLIDKHVQYFYYSI